MEKYCYLNGKILNIKEAKISVTDIGVLRGFGVFDYLRSYKGKPFLLKEHLKRFKNSAKLAGLKIKITDKKIEEIIRKLLAKNKLPDAGIRIVVTGGESTDGMDWDKNSPNFFILIQKLHDYSMKMYEKGVSLITHEFIRENSGAKSNNYLTRIKLSDQLKKQKAHEILYINNGKVLEGATCNIFAFTKNTLITPKNDILCGTRRSLIIKLAKEYFKVFKKDVDIKEMLNADEVFITSTTRDIMPVTKIDNQKIAGGQVGAKTKKLMQLYQEYINKHR